MLYFLTGITASGKSDLAHRIAIEKNMSILSVDSMAVYKGLDVLTAKPSDVMQAQVKYYGLDIADCDQNFSIIDYLNYLIDQNIPEKTFNEDILAVGGSGLYIKAIIDRYEFKPTDPTIRSELEQLNFDQLILEFYTPGEPNSGWIHCSYTTDQPRKQFLHAYKSEGKTKYKPVIGKAVDLV